MRLIIGGGGQDGYFLAKWITYFGGKVDIITSRTGVLRQHSESQRMIHVPNYHEALEEILMKANVYTHIYLVGGLVGNKLALERPIYVYEGNILTVTTVARCLRVIKYAGAVVYFSSSDIIGAGEGVMGKSVRADHFRDNRTPLTTYGLSKKHSIELLRLISKESAIDIRFVHLFMHESNKRKGNYLMSRIKDICSDPKKYNEPIEGNLNIYIDLSCADEMMKAVYLLSEINDGPIDVVIGSGEWVNMWHLVKSCLEYSGVKWENYINEQNFLEELRYPRADTSEIETLIGFKPNTIRPCDIVGNAAIES